VLNKSKYLNLKRLHRDFKVTFPLTEIGFIADHDCKTTQGDKGFELCLRLSSETKYSNDIIGDTRYQLRFPNVFLKVPGVWRQISVEGKRDAVFFKYEPSLKEEMEKAGLLKPPYCWEIRLTPAINTILKECEELIPYLYRSGTAEKFDLLAMQMFQEVLLYRDREKGGHDETDETIRQIAAHLHSHFLEEQDWDALLKNNGLSRRNFFRRWKEMFDVSPAASIRELKLDYARSLLAESDIPVWELTRLLNFSNSNYFCSIFKKQYGITPYEYHTKMFQRKKKQEMEIRQGGKGI
jgi:AraC-like DNA-binding protein